MRAETRLAEAGGQDSQRGRKAGGAFAGSIACLSFIVYDTPDSVRTEERKAMALPQISPEQRAAALEAAKASRKKRAEAKAGIAAGKMKFSELLGTEDEVLKKMKVAEAVKTVPGYGKAKADALLAEIGIAEGRRIGGVGAKQKEALIERLG